MTDLHSFDLKKDPKGKTLNEFEKFSVYYHNLFDYPLNFSELLRWTPGVLPQKSINDCDVAIQGNYFSLKGSEGLIYQRALRERISRKKMLIAKRSAKLLSVIPWVKVVAVSGSLAMQNAEKGSDIDLLLITSKDRLWTTRILSYLLLKVSGTKLRKPNDSNEKDKLCLNIWLDETDLPWKKKERNIYTAHEIAQLIPLVNKNKVFEKFLYQNRWITKYWPNGVRIKRKIEEERVSIPNKSFLNPIFNIFEKFCYKLQYQYMKPKITTEVISLKHAIFHPNNLSKRVLNKLSY